MAGVTSLGLGSGSKLNGETITKLKDADTRAIIKPIERKIDEYEQKQASLQQFQKLLNATNSYTKELKDDGLYLQRSVNVIGDGVTSTVEDGVDPQSIAIKVEQIAKEHILQSDAFVSKGASVAADDTKLEIIVGDDNYKFDIKAGLQLQDLVSQINEKAGKSVKANILHTGKDEYRMVLRTKETGEGHRIDMIQGTEEKNEEKKTIEKIPLPLPRDPETDEILIDPETDLPFVQKYEEVEVIEEIHVPATDLLANLYNNIQEAQNAVFTYNGAEIQRESNVIEDMVVGLSFTLESVTPLEQQVVIDVVQDTIQIIEQVEGFVAQYNALLTEIGNMTKFDLEENEKGIFIGENTITSIRTKINNLLTSLDKDGNSIADYGLNFLRTGQLELDKFTLMQKVKNEPENTQQYFKGTLEELNGKEEIKNGLFYKINLALDDIVNSANGSVTNFERSIERQLKRTEEEKVTANKRLDDRYETLANQFADADSAINRMKKGFESVEMQIKQSQASK